MSRRFSSSRIPMNSDGHCQVGPFIPKQKRAEGFCRKVRFLEQNPKTGCRKFNDLQSLKLVKNKLCDRTDLLFKRPPRIGGDLVVCVRLTIHTRSLHPGSRSEFAGKPLDPSRARRRRLRDEWLGRCLMQACRQPAIKR